MTFFTDSIGARQCRDALPVFLKTLIAYVLPVVLPLLGVGCQYIVPIDDKLTDYRIELGQIGAEIERLGQRASGENEQDALRLIYQLYRRAGLTNDFSDYRATEAALRRAFSSFGPSQQWYLFHANFNFKLHRLAEAKSDLIALERYGGSPQGEILKADIALQQGQYQIAGQAFAEICRENPSWDNLARLAYFKMHTGEPEAADALYRQAQDLLSVKQMRHFAWLELQRGLIDLEGKHYRDALNHYLLAERAYSGYWLVREHIAEVYALLGRRDEAVELYRTVIEQTRNPEFLSALGVIYEAEGNPEANELYARADALFDGQYRLFPEAAVGHFVESLLKRRGVDRRLLEYARRNHRWRANGQAKYLLARAEQKVGNEAGARNLMQHILDSPWRSGDIETLAAELGMN